MKKQNMRTIKKRRRIRKTNYKTRLKLLKSGLPRVVIRKTNRYIISQYIKSKEAKDHVIVTINSKNLLKYGWESAGSLKSIPACYLTGLLLGKEILKKDKDAEAILDIGLARNIKKSRVFAILKGLVDSGLNIRAEKEGIFPDEQRIKGEHLKNKIDFEKIKQNIQK